MYRSTDPGAVELQPMKLESSMKSGKGVWYNVKYE
jgi:hypothetical protein